MIVKLLLKFAAREHKISYERSVHMYLTLSFPWAHFRVAEHTHTQQIATFKLMFSFRNFSMNHKTFDEAKIDWFLIMLSILFA